MSSSSSTVSVSSRRTWQQHINMVAALIVVILLVSSFALVFSYTHRGSMSTQNNQRHAAGKGTWRLTGSMHDARALFSAVLLHNGKVLVVGGWDKTNTFALASAELYDPTTGKWSVTGNLHVARADEKALVLPDGKVLVTGGGEMKGGNLTTLSSAELYDPATGTWSMTGSMNTSRYSQTATLLSNGEVLITGGISEKGAQVSLVSTEMYHSVTGTWSLVGNMHFSRAGQTATLLYGNTVLVAGGSNIQNGSVLNLASAEVITAQ